MHTEYPETLR